MPLDLVDYKSLAATGVKQFWLGRGSPLNDKDGDEGDSDLDDALAGGSISEVGDLSAGSVADGSERDNQMVQGGERQNVVSGKNLDGFLTMFKELVAKNGLPDAEVCVSNRPSLTLPGYFRPTKLWDVVVIHKGKLVAAIELKSHVGSFGNNFNNRTEEAIGTALDFCNYRQEGGMPEQAAPFLGWLILVEDCPKSRKTVAGGSKHFPVMGDFVVPAEPVDPTSRRKRKPAAPRLVSYLERYDVLCKRLMAKRLYSQAAVMASPRSAVEDGAFSDMSPETSLRSLVAGLAGYVAAWAATHDAAP